MGRVGKQAGKGRTSGVLGHHMHWRAHGLHQVADLVEPVFRRGRREGAAVEKGEDAAVEEIGDHGRSASDKLRERFGSCRELLFIRSRIAVADADDAAFVAPGPMPDFGDQPCGKAVPVKRYIGFLLLLACRCLRGELKAGIEDELGFPPKRAYTR